MIDYALENDRRNLVSYLRTAAATLALAGVLAACAPASNLPSDCSAAAAQRSATLAGAHMDPEAIEVCLGQHVTLAITTQRAGELHLHGYDKEVPEVAVAAGETARLAFTAVRSGQFVIELHAPDGTEAQVGLLTVHEP